MTRKVILVTDPGLDGAVAIALALLDPALEIVGLAASAGNVSAEQATQNLHTLVELLDPPRYPRLGAALPATYGMNATDLHGPDGLGGIDLPCARLHHPHAADKLVLDLLRQYPKELTLVLLGPATLFARVMDRNPEALELVHQIVQVGGTWHEAGDAGPVTEFHFACDPLAARQVMRCGAPVTLLPLDVTRKLVLSPADLLLLAESSQPTCQLLRRLLTPGIRATAGLFGVEGFHLMDVLGVLAVSQPHLLTTRLVVGTVETRGEMTRGMSVFDTRWGITEKPNIELATSVDVAGARRYVLSTLGLG
jgi:inosine-uridine nucleoside N-ribohydrolase